MATPFQPTAAELAILRVLWDREPCTVRDVHAGYLAAGFSKTGKIGTYGGMPTGLIIELGGKRVYFAGDTNLFGDMSLIGEQGLDAALLPIGDHYTMGPEEAARTLDLLKPKVAIPMHYGTFPPLTGDPAVFRREGEARGVDVRILKPGEHTTL